MKKTSRYAKIVPIRPRSYRFQLAGRMFASRMKNGYPIAKRHEVLGRFWFQLFWSDNSDQYT